MSLRRSAIVNDWTLQMCRMYIQHEVRHISWFSISSIGVFQILWKVGVITYLQFILRFDLKSWIVDVTIYLWQNTTKQFFQCRKYQGIHFVMWYILCFCNVSFAIFSPLCFDVHDSVSNLESSNDHLENSAYFTLLYMHIPMWMKVNGIYRIFKYN